MLIFFRLSHLPPSFALASVTVSSSFLVKKFLPVCSLKPDEEEEEALFAITCYPSPCRSKLHIINLLWFAAQLDQSIGLHRPAQSALQFSQFIGQTIFQTKGALWFLNFKRRSMKPDQK